MNIPIRKTLIGCKVIDIEERQNELTFYIKNEHGAVFAVNIEGKHSNTILVGAEEDRPQYLGVNLDVSEGSFVDDVLKTIVYGLQQATSAFSDKKEAAQEVPVQEQLNKQEIKLSEKEQRNLFCTAWHLTNFLEDSKEEKIANFATPCETCKYQKECLENDHFDALTHFETLTKLTGVQFNALKYARKKGLFDFLKKEQLKDY